VTSPRRGATSPRRGAARTISRCSRPHVRPLQRKKTRALLGAAAIVRLRRRRSRRAVRRWPPREDAAQDQA
jgi:hypothetical protein